jgi:hypothetical protein
MSAMREAFEKFRTDYKNGATGTHFITEDVFTAGGQAAIEHVKAQPYVRTYLLLNEKSANYYRIPEDA